MLIFQAIIQQFDNLVKLCENIERDFFERLNSASEDDDNGAFVKLPWQWANFKQPASWDEPKFPMEILEWWIELTRKDRKLYIGDCDIAVKPEESL